MGHVTYFWNCGTPSISRERVKLKTSNLAWILITRGTNEEKCKIRSKEIGKGSRNLLLQFCDPISRERVKLETLNMALIYWSRKALTKIAGLYALQQFSLAQNNVEIPPVAVNVVLAVHKNLVPQFPPLHFWLWHLRLAVSVDPYQTSAVTKHTTGIKLPKKFRRFPMSLRWSSYVAPTSPTGGLKNAKRPISV